MVKVLHLLAQLPAQTGSGIYFRNIIEGFKSYPYRQKAVFAVQDGFCFEGLPSSDQYPVEFKTGLLPFAIAGMSDVMPYESTVYSQMDERTLQLWQQAFRRQLLHVREEFAPDIIISHHLWFLTDMAIEVFPQALRIGICHNTDLRQVEQHPYFAAPYTAHIRHLDMVLALSKEQVGRISDLYGCDSSRIFALGGGFNEKLFYPQPQAAKEHIDVVFAAKISQSKGVFELIKAFRQISRSRRDLRLYIIGNAYDDNAFQLVKSIGNADNIFVLPAMPQTELAEFIRDKDIFVMPSYFEGLGLIALECLASGLLVVASEIPGLISLLGDKVNSSPVIEYVPLPALYDIDKPCAEDIPAFVQALSERLSLQISRVEQGFAFPEEIYRQIAQHSWGKIIARIDDLISQHRCA